MAERREIYFDQQPIGFIVDRFTLSVWTNRSEETIRRRCTVYRYHPDGRALYVMDAAADELTKHRHTRTRSGELRSEQSDG